MFAAGVGLMYYSYHDSHKHKITVKGRYIFNQTFNKKDITFEDKSMISSCRFIDCKITIKGTSSFIGNEFIDTEFLGDSIGYKFEGNTGKIIL